MDMPPRIRAAMRDGSPPAGSMVNLLVVANLLFVLLLAGMVCGLTAGILMVRR